MTYNSLQHIFTTMIGFVTWPPLTASDWPHPFFTPKVFLFSISLLFWKYKHMLLPELGVTRYNCNALRNILLFK